MHVLILRCFRQDEVELPGHAQMHHERPAIVQQKEQVLAPSVRVDDLTSHQLGAERFRRFIRKHARPEDLYGQDAMAHQQGFQITHSVFDFREFRHGDAFLWVNRFFIPIRPPRFQKTSEVETGSMISHDLRGLPRPRRSAAMYSRHCTTAGTGRKNALSLSTRGRCFDLSGLSRKRLPC